MPRVNHVKKAQQRYKTVPVLDENGNPTYRENQRARPTKRGVTVTRQRVTVADKNQPLPPLRCDFPGCPSGVIAVGESYKWIKPKSGPYGGSQRNRHESHPSWHPWEYSSSLGARTAQIQHEAWEAINSTNLESPEDVTSVLEWVADEVRGLVEEKRESASNIEDGFGHPTSQSEELEGIADELESWADDIENADVPELPDPEEVDCAECEGNGVTDEGCDDCQGAGVIEDTEGNITGDCSTCGGDGQVEVDCADCDGSGQVESEEPTAEQMDAWRDEVEQLFSIIDECPV